MRLVALLHDVGSVSLADPCEASDIDPRVVAQSTARVLDEAGYPPPYAAMVLAAAEGPARPPLEAQILRVANKFDELDGPAVDRLAMLAASASHGESIVVSALSRVIGGTVPANGTQTQVTDHG
jgi:hypothetical protein